VRSPHLPWAKEKTLAGTAAMFLGGWVFTLLMLFVFISAGVFTYSFSAMIAPVTFLVLIATVVESLPFRDIDNLTIPAAVMIAGYFLF